MKRVPLSSGHPAIAAEAHGWDPSTVGSSSREVKEWICLHGHVWRARVKNRVRGGGCHYCAGKLPIPGVSDLVTTYPVVAAQASGWDPSTVSAGSSKMKRWLCQHGHVWDATVSSRVRGNGCPTCAGKIPVPGLSDLATTHPNLAEQAHGCDPSSVSSGSDRKVEWKCGDGHLWIASVGSRAKLGTGCPYCSGRRPIVGLSDLCTTHPHLANEAHGWNPRDVSAGSGARRDWICERGHVWVATVGSRANLGSGCPYCAGQRVVAGENDVQSRFPLIALEAFGWNPSTVAVGSHQQKNWKCVAAGHEWTAAVYSRIAGRSCPYCAGQRVLVGFNDLATKNPQLASEACGWDPSTVFPMSNTKRRWRCDLGHEWNASPNTRTSGSGCPSCAKFGYDPSEDGWVYLLRNEGLELFQIGITNHPHDRLRKHSRRGWDPIDVEGPMDGQTAREIETDVLRYLDRLGVPRGNAITSSFDGFTESWRTMDLAAESVRALREAAREV